ncbi:MAG: DUF5808 domain-containing protein [Haloferacaceae archaeon]
MSDDSSGKVFGVPYNFERPSLGRMLAAYWQPGEGMLVRKPFGVGYTLNLASWRSWVVLLVAGVLFWHERESGSEASPEGESGGSESGEDEGPVEVVVD